MSPSLHDAVEDVGIASWSGTAYRHTARQFAALSGAGAAALGGRWNIPGVPTIYLAEPEAACIAEFRRMAGGQPGGIAAFLPRDLHVVQVDALRVLDLRPTGVRRRLRITLTDIEGEERQRCQQIAEAARHAGAQGIVAPSATRAGVVIAVFEHALRRGQLNLVETRALAV